LNPEKVATQIKRKAAMLNRATVLVLSRERPAPDEARLPDVTDALDGSKGSRSEEGPALDIVSMASESKRKIRIWRQAKKAEDASFELDA
jgi:hypothetical protein